jgi:hypothetical protein
VKTDKFSYAPSIDNEESDASVAQNTKETELKLTKISLTIGGVKSDYAYDKSTTNVYDYNSYLAAKEMGGEPLMVGKIVDKDGSKSFVKMSAASAAESPAPASATAKPKKSEGGVAMSRKPSESEGAKKLSSAAATAATAAPPSIPTPTPKSKEQ